MSGLTHDPDFPFVFRYSSGDKPTAKFRNRQDAEAYADNYAYGSVVDTTPIPVPTEPGIYRASDWSPTLFYVLETSGTWRVHWSNGEVEDKDPGCHDLTVMKRLEDA